MIRVFNMFARLKGIALAMALGGGLVACSTSEFGAKAIKSSGDGKAEAETDNGNSGETLNSDGAKELDGRSDSARSNDIDDTMTGCQLPEDISAKIGTGGSVSGGKGGFGLLGWGSSDSANPEGLPELTNLDLNDCEWFKNNPNTKQVFVFQQKSLGLVEGVTQSYVEPVPEGGKCFSAASISKTIRDRGTLLCATLPAPGTTNFD